MNIQENSVVNAIMTRMTTSMISFKNITNSIRMEVTINVLLLNKQVKSRVTNQIANLVTVNLQITLRNQTKIVTPVVVC